MYRTIIYHYYRVPSAPPSNNFSRRPPSFFPTRHLSPDLKVDRANFLRIMLENRFPHSITDKELLIFFFFFTKFKVQDPLPEAPRSQLRARKGAAWRRRCGAQRIAAQSRRAERASFGWQASQSTQPEKGSGRLVILLFSL